jgi:hypothetical protein
MDDRPPISTSSTSSSSSNTTSTGHAMPRSGLGSASSSSSSPQPTPNAPASTSSSSSSTLGGKPMTLTVKAAYGGEIRRLVVTAKSANGLGAFEALHSQLFDAFHIQPPHCIVKYVDDEGQNPQLWPLLCLSNWQQKKSDTFDRLARPAGRLCYLL